MERKKEVRVKDRMKKGWEGEGNWRTVGPMSTASYAPVMLHH